MKQLGKRLLSSVLVLALMLQILPASIFATENHERKLTMEELLLTDEGSLVDAEESSAEILFEVVSLREENVKHFRMTDGTYTAVVYDTPVHYLDEDGVWQEYDNTLHALSRNGEGAVYCVENGDSVRLFAADTQSDALLSVSKGEYALTLSPILAPNAESAGIGNGEIEATENSELTVTAEVLSVCAPAEDVIKDDFYAQAQPAKLYSALEYDSILDGATLRYENYANSMKESIVIEEPREEYCYSFQMQTVGLTPSLQDDGSIDLTNADGGCVYSIPTPYMIDANDELSYDASYSLTASGDGWILTVTADAQWMNAEDRAYPVLLDPTVTETAATDEDICAAFVRSGYPASPDTTDTGLYVGNNGNSNGKTRSYFHINTLPTLPDGCELTGALFSVYQYSFSGSNELEIGAYALTKAGNLTGRSAVSAWQSWADTLTWNQTSGTTTADTVALDCLRTSSANNNSYLSFDLSTLAFQWYHSDHDGTGAYLNNLGFMLKPTEEDSVSSRVTLYGPKKTMNRPRITIAYTNVRGIESDYTYQTASVGRAGTAYIGDFAMQNVLVVPLASAPSDVMPFSVSLVYNSGMTGRYFSGSYSSLHTTNFDSMKTGIGWKLSIQETIVPLTVSGTTYLVYTDSDGTEHYYLYSSTEGAYVEEGTGTRMTIAKSGSQYTISDEYGNKKIFTNGYLTQASDAYGNALYYCYNAVDYSTGSTGWKPSSTGANKITSVWRVNNGCSAEKILVLGYSGEFLSTIIPKCDYSDETSKDAYRIYLSYETRNSGKYLTQIQFADGEKAQYQYISSEAEYYRMNKMCSAYDAEANYGLEFDYSYSGNAKELFEYILTNTSGENEESNREYGVKMHGFKRSHTLAVWRDYGRDQVDDSTVAASENHHDDYLTFKVLSRTGRTVCAYTTDSNEARILGSSAAEYTASSNRKQNDLLSANSYTAQPGINLLCNSGAENNASYWSSVDFSTAVHYSGKKSFVLNNNTFYQLVTLSANTTYTFSAYLRLDSATEDSSVHIALVDSAGETLSASPAITASTLGVDDGWQRLSTTYTTGSSSVTVRASVISSGLSECAYADCLQLEAEDAASTYDLLENGSFEQNVTITSTVPAIGWYCAGNVSVTSDETAHFGDKMICVNGGSGYRRVSQTIDLNAPAGSTFLLSGWGRANALPGSVAEKSEEDQAYFGLIARLYYADGSSDVFYFPFNSYSGDWQQTNGILAPKDGNEEKVITKATVVAAYDNNINTAYFDNLSLRREPAQTYRYDENGNLVSATQTDSGSESATYENGVDLTQYTAANGTKYTYTYNSAHDVTTAKVAGLTATTTYNAAGNVTGSKLTGTDTSYYLQSTATPTADKNHTASVTDANGNTTQYTYDGNHGKLTAVTDAKGQTTNYTYETGSLRTETTERSGIATIAYDYTGGRLTQLSRTTLRGSTQQEQNYNFAYNAWGQLTTTKVGNRTLSTNAYYAVDGESTGAGGNLKSTTYGNGQYVTYTYDKLDRLIRTQYNSGRYITYAYSAEGQISRIAYGDGSTAKGSYDFEYDSLGRLIRSVEYDGSGTVKQRTEHLYDAYNRLSSQSWILGGTPYTESYTYSDGENGDGSITKMTTATGDTISYTYDALKRLQKTATANASGTTLFTTAYAFRTVSGNQTSSQIEYRNIRIGTNGTILEGKKYTYDALGNIIGIYESTGKYRQLVAYTYDSQNQLLSETYYTYSGTSTTPATTTVYEYTYDTAGNILTASKNGTVTQTYTYGNTQWRDLLTAVNGNAISCDASNNPTNWYNGKSYTGLTWVNGRQLSAITTGGTRTTYAYDADGIRSSKTVGTTVHTYLTQSGKVVRETIGSGSTAKVLDFIYDESGRPFALKYSTNGGSSFTTYYYVLNLQGDVVKLVTSSGTAVAEYSYDAWGNLLTSSGEKAEINPLRYRGYYYDTETGFYYLQSRYYDPVNHRFINVDVYASTDSTDAIACNMFAYCLNDPINRTDMDGTDSIWHYLFANGEFGWIHRCVQDHIVAHNIGIIEKERAVYDMFGGMVGRVDVFEKTTGKIWEVKTWNGELSAKMQLQKYIGNKFQDDNVAIAGEAGRFTGAFVVNCLGESYSVTYATPDEGVILYAVNKIAYQPECEYAYAPKKVRQKAALSPAVAAAPCVFVFAVPAFGGGAPLEQELLYLR